MPVATCPYVHEGRIRREADYGYRKVDSGLRVVPTGGHGGARWDRDHTYDLPPVSRGVDDHGRRRPGRSRLAPAASQPFRGRLEALIASARGKMAPPWLARPVPFPLLPTRPVVVTYPRRALNE